MFSAERAGITFIGSDRQNLFAFFVSAIPFAVVMILLYNQPLSESLFECCGSAIYPMLPNLTDIVSNSQNSIKEPIYIASGIWLIIIVIQLPLFILFVMQAPAFYRKNIKTNASVDVPKRILKGVQNQQWYVSICMPIFAIICLLATTTSSSDLEAGNYFRYTVMAIGTLLFCSVGLLAFLRGLIIKHLYFDGTRLEFLN